MSKIIIALELFHDRAQLFYYDGDSLKEKEHIDINMLVKYVSAKANINNVEYIGLNGLTIYCEQYKDAIQETLVTEYGNNNITIEVL